MRFALEIEIYASYLLTFLPNLVILVILGILICLRRSWILVLTWARVGKRVLTRADRKVLTSPI